MHNVILYHVRILLYNILFFYSFLQIPIIAIVPTSLSKTAKMRDLDEAFVMIAHPDDEGKSYDEFPIVVSNGEDHFVGTVSTQPTFS